LARVREGYAGRDHASPQGYLNKLSSLTYRRDIDGLRAVAVLAVVAFHASPHRLPGGFIGVDIFFVISGFLITSILKKANEEKSFSLIGFYQRRIKRIFPSLLVVCACSAIFGYLTLFQNEFAQLGKHIAGGVSFISNFVLHSESGYFESSSDLKPLLHLWSLGIEEQYYIFFPVILFLAYWRKVNPLRMIVSLAVLSFALSIYARNNLSFADGFYLPWFRFWEIGVGAILAYAQPSLQRKKILQEVSSYVGLLLITLAVLSINPASRFPGYLALLPTTGAALLLLSPSSYVNRNVLSHPVVVYIGLISYPLYLWHWPALSFLHIFEETSLEARLLAVALSFILAILTYEFVEKKVKKIRLAATWKPLSTLSLLVFFSGLLFMDIIKPRMGNVDYVNTAEIVADWEGVKDWPKFDKNGVTLSTMPGDVPGTVLLWGDSHLEQYAPRVRYLMETSKEDLKTVVVATLGGVPPIPGVYDKNHPSATSQWYKTILEYALSDSVDAVVLGGFWSRYIGNDLPEYLTYFYDDDKKTNLLDGGNILARESLRKTLRKISLKKPVFLLLDIPHLVKLHPKHQRSYNRFTRQSDYGPAYIPEGRDMELEMALIEIARSSGATAINASKEMGLSKDGLVRARTDDNKLIFKDTHHLRPFFVIENATFIDKLIK
jgi:peptidoglycan/LPS O-acetylase OafA/YrhL